MPEYEGMMRASYLRRRAMPAPSNPRPRSTSDGRLRDILLARGAAIRVSARVVRGRVAEEADARQAVERCSRSSGSGSR